MSLVTKDEPFRQHPNELVGKEGCRGGVCTLPITDYETMSRSFTFGIQCSRRNDFLAALEDRKVHRIDPFNGEKRSVM